MTDFDFDELDRAVSGALGNDPVDTPAVRPEEPQRSTPQPEPREVVAPRPVQAAAPAMRRNGGRFMDVVHPSSDMRTRSNEPVNIQPLAAAEAPATPVEPATPVAPVAPAPSSSVSTAELEFEEIWQAPLDSPFLPDAQVQKRPLGTSAPTGDLIGSAPLESQLLLDEPDELRLEEPDELRIEADVHTMPDPIDFATSNDDTVESPVVEEVATSVIDVEPVIQQDPTTVSQPAFETAAQPITSERASDHDLSRAAALDSEEQPVGPTSITQQYTEKPAQQAEPGSIYDTENYHQPINAPAKKKSGGLAILWILLILVLGAGAGVVFYFYVLPTL